MDCWTCGFVLTIFTTNCQLFSNKMDKIAANNHFVVMRKEVKKAKAMVSGNLIRKIGKLKLEKDKLEDEEKKKKIDDKIDVIYNETKLLKTIDPYLVSKNATLRPDSKLWDKIIGDSRATTEERLIARIITKNNIQRQVQKFRTDYKDCDEWINEYIEYREKKKEIQKPTNLRKGKQNFRDDRTSNRGRKENSRSNFTDFRDKKHDSTTRKRNASPTREKLENIQKEEKDSLHPSWAIKRKEKELLKAAFSGQLSQPKRITFDG